MTYPVTSDLKTDLGISSSADDTKLGLYVAEAKDFAEMYCNRVFVAVEATQTFPAESPFIDASLRNLWTYQEFMDASALTINGVTIPTAQYRFSSYNGKAPYMAIKLRRASTYRFTDLDGLTDISVTADWGYSTACPSGVFGAIIAYAGWRYKANTTGRGGVVTTASKKGSVGVDVATVPDEITDILNLYVKGR